MYYPIIAHRRTPLNEKEWDDLVLATFNPIRLATSIGRDVGYVATDPISQSAMARDLLANHDFHEVTIRKPVNYNPFDLPKGCWVSWTIKAGGVTYFATVREPNAAGNYNLWHNGSDWNPMVVHRPFLTRVPVQFLHIIADNLHVVSGILTPLNVSNNSAAGVFPLTKINEALNRYAHLPDAKIRSVYLSKVCPLDPGIKVRLLQDYGIYKMGELVTVRGGCHSHVAIQGRKDQLNHTVPLNYLRVVNSFYA